MGRWIAHLIILLASLPASYGLARADQPIVAIFTKNFTNPAYEGFRIGADKVLKAAGARTIHYVPKKPDNVEEQTAMVEEALRQKPDIVLFVPVDDAAMVEPARKFAAAKIPVVLFINQMQGSFVTFVGSDDVEIGTREARALVDKLAGKGNVVIIEGTPAAPTSRDRVRGANAVLAAAPGIKLLASAIGNYQRGDAKREMARLLKEHPVIDGVVAANDIMAMGVIEALAEAGRTSVVVGANGTPEAARQIEAGKMLASVDFNSFKMACISAEAALKHLKGEKVPAKILLPADLIDARNYRDWLTPLAERKCPSWSEIVR